MVAKKVAIELLAPARDKEVGKVAIDAGADAVYIGAPKFGARQAAGNSIDDIRELCEYAHLFGCKVWITLNTLLYDEEIKEAVDTAWQVAEAGADGILIQDLRLLNYDLPKIRLHASTQCDNRTAEDVINRYKAGFKRAVLARELNTEEIAQIRQETIAAGAPIELEAFIHGALCVSYSGRCYMSEYVNGRSANRGCCSQMCRQRYDLLDKDRNIIIKDKYVLSLKDMDRSQYLRQMLDAGVRSLKIEGRLKDANYVKNIVGYYRQLLDQLFAAKDSKYCKASEGEVYFDFTPNPELTFHRGGTAYMFPTSERLANWETPKSTGELIGFAPNAEGQQITPPEPLEDIVTLRNGDGLCIGDKGFYVNGITQKRGDKEGYIIKTSSNEQIEITLQPNEGERYLPVYRNYNKQFVETLERSRVIRKIAVEVELSETETGFSLQIGGETKEFEQEKIAAKNAEQAEENIKRQLGKLGNTIYEAKEIRVKMKQPWFIPTSTINEWRREVCQALDEKRRKARIEETNNERGIGGFAKQQEGIPEALMTCRYCILREMGMCRKQRGKGEVREPEYIRTGKNVFRLRFDCGKCEMKVGVLEGA